ncbi:hypothetical protein MHBO_001421, partial [Bonamia ostreae]
MLGLGGLGYSGLQSGLELSRSIFANRSHKRLESEADEVYRDPSYLTTGLMDRLRTDLNTVRDFVGLYEGNNTITSPGNMSQLSTGYTNFSELFDPSKIDQNMRLINSRIAKQREEEKAQEIRNMIGSDTTGALSGITEAIQSVAPENISFLSRARDVFRRIDPTTTSQNFVLATYADKLFDNYMSKKNKNTKDAIRDSIDT